MNTREILEQKLYESYMRGNVKFIVMNKSTAQSIIDEIPWNGTLIKMNTYKGIEVLISESLEDNEFRIG